MRITGTTGTAGTGTAGLAQDVPPQRDAGAEPERHQKVDAQRPATQARETGEQGRGEGAQSAVGETQEESEEGEDDESAGRRRRRHQPEAAGPEEQCGVE